MSATTDSAGRAAQHEADMRLIAARRRGYLIGSAATVAVVFVVLLLLWPIVDENLYLRDDRGLGNSFRTHVEPSTTLCDRLAESLYGRPMGMVGGDWAPRSEKAFYAGCTGTPFGGD
jgi:hypothetical protein